jgi:hypothetical protein
MMSEAVSMNSSGSGSDAPIGVGGWLLLLCGVLLVWQPVVLGVVATNSLPALTTRGTPFGLLLAGRVLATAAGIGAGIALMDRAPTAVPFAKVALTLSAAVDLLVYTTPHFPNNRMPGDTPFYIAGTVLNYLVWMLYLARSRRVRATFD